MALFRTQNEDVRDYDIVRSRVGKGSDLHRDSDAPVLAGDGGEPLSQLYAKHRYFISSYFGLLRLRLCDLPIFFFYK